MRTLFEHISNSNVCSERVMKMRCNVRENDVLCNVLTLGSMVNTNVTLTFKKSAIARAGQAENIRSVTREHHTLELSLFDWRFEITVFKSKTTLSVLTTVVQRTFVFLFYRALRQWRRGKIALITTLKVPDSLNFVQHLQPQCLENRFLPFLQQGKRALPKVNHQHIISRGRSASANSTSASWPKWPKSKLAEQS